MDRPKPEAVKTHTLMAHKVGANRFEPGRYLCSCGTVLTSVDKYRAHRGTERRKEREAAYAKKLGDLGVAQ